jgi:carbon monoxide dehydrogenase subunit G
MKTTDQIDIDATPEQVWPFLADPVLQAAWNPKIISIDRPCEGLVRIGETYRMTAKHTNAQQDSEVHVVDVIEAQQLTFEHRTAEAGTGFVVIEAITLTPMGAGTRVEQTVDLSKTPIPWLLRPVIRFVMKFGKRAGGSQLIGLKQMVESELA